jgi:enamine deaminase RidA (YjgF/YER057c/UK114 family)
MTVARLLALLLAFALLSTAAQKRKNKKDEEPVTQTLEVLPDPPPAVRADSARLIFLTSPLSAKGLLSQQTRDALNALHKQAKGATIVKLRAFVAGRGDARRVSGAVSEMFSHWRQPLPALTILQVGALPLEGAQIQLEAIAEDRRPHNPNGLEWLEGKMVVKPLADSGGINAVGPLLAESLSALTGDILSVTCFVSSLDGAADLDQSVAMRFPNAARVLVQAQRATGSGLAQCEAIARRASGDAPRLVLTGSIIGFGREEKDAQLADSRLIRLLTQNESKLWVKKTYAISRALEPLLGAIRLVEGVGPNEASFAVEAVGLP